MRALATLSLRVSRNPLGLAVDPVQVFKDQDQGLVQALAQEEFLERLERPPSADLRVHLGQRRSRIFDA